MHRFVRVLATTIAAVIAFAPVDAVSRTIVSSLGTEPLIGKIISADDLARQSRTHRAVLVVAARRLGLTKSEFLLIYLRIQQHRLRRVTIPRYLDEMTWLRGNRVLINNDLIIPANIPGWEIDLPRFGSIVRVFLPSTCGNLSLIVHPVAVAQAFTLHVTRPSPTPWIVKLPPATFAPTLAAAPVVTAQVPALIAVIPQVSGVTHHFPWLLLIAPVLIGMIHSGPGGGVAAVPPPIIATPPSTFICFESPFPHCDRKQP